MSEQQHEDQEVVFRRREGEEPLRGRMCIANGIVTVTAARRSSNKHSTGSNRRSACSKKNTQLGVSPARSLARRMLYELEKERLERLKPKEDSETH